MLPEIPLEKNIKGIGEKRARQFEKLGVRDVDALLHYYPRDYEDWSSPIKIAFAEPDEKVCVKARVDSNPTVFYSKSGMAVYRTTASDESGVMNIVIFNNRFAAGMLRAGGEYLFYGKMEIGINGRQMLSPAIGSAYKKQIIRPVYKASGSLTSGRIENYVLNALRQYLDREEETLPEEIIKEYGLMPIKDAIKNIHFPESVKMIEQSRRRFIFEEFFLLQTGMHLLRKEGRTETHVVLKKTYEEEFYSTLPFAPTGAQRRAVEAGLKDMQSGILMNRLVQGDVGSGKTLVAAALCHSVIKNGYQCAIMAPTEILAVQHAETLKKFFENTGIEVALLTGNTKASEKKRIREGLDNGEISMVAGTHALLTEGVEFRNPGLVITDEQHRFGVNQRGMLASKGKGVHVLVMSATPIPRTLALSIYGDLDVSVIDEMPAGRRPVDTYCINGKIRQRAFSYIKKFLDEGRQGYIVCPLVQETEESDGSMVSAVSYYEKISSGEFRAYSVGLLHGQMKSKEKEEVMKRFVDGEIQLLVTTTVIEVGVDVPNAVIMLIENAERFGLSQLHQLRGRVGRGDYQSTCILLSDSRSGATMERLKVMCETGDGFEISQRDLLLRGPGDFFGERQHGLPELHIADLCNDMKVLEEAGEASRKVVSEDPGLTGEKNRLLLKQIETLFSENGSSL